MFAIAVCDFSTLYVTPCCDFNHRVLNLPDSFSIMWDRVCHSCQWLSSRYVESLWLGLKSVFWWLATWQIINDLKLTLNLEDLWLNLIWDMMLWKTQWEWHCHDDYLVSQAPCDATWWSVDQIGSSSSCLCQESSLSNSSFTCEGKRWILWPAHQRFQTLFIILSLIQNSESVSMLANITKIHCYQRT